MSRIRSAKVCYLLHAPLCSILDIVGISFIILLPDCELVALLEDDTGMELLVCNKIISLDLPVKDVYKKIWVPQHGEVSSRSKVISPICSH